MMLVKTKAARELLNGYFSNPSSHSPEGLKEVLNTKTTTLIGIDRDFKIELGLLEEMVGKKADKRLYDAVLATLPTATNYIAADQTLRDITEILAKELFKYASAGSQGQAQWAHRSVGHVVSGAQPHILDAKSTEFSHTFFSKLQFFVRHPAGAEGQGCLVGADALTTLLNDGKDKHTRGEASFDDVAPFETFEWLVPKDIKATVDAIVKEIVAKLPTRAGATQASKDDYKTDALQTKADNASIAAAMDMFK